MTVNLRNYSNSIIYELIVINYFKIKNIYLKEYVKVSTHILYL